MRLFSLRRCLCNGILWAILLQERSVVLPKNVDELFGGHLVHDHVSVNFLVYQRRALGRRGKHGINDLFILSKDLVGAVLDVVLQLAWQTHVHDFQ